MPSAARAERRPLTTTESGRGFAQRFRLAAVGYGRATMIEFVLIGLGSSATVAVAVRLLDRLLDFDELAALPDGDGRDGDRR